MANIKLISVGIFQGEKNYEKVKFLAGYNREVRPQAIKLLMVSMAVYGFKGVAIVIRTKAFSDNGKEQDFIADGQTRISAAERLGIPYNYEIVKFEGKDDTRKNVCKFIATLNSSATNWFTNKYLDIYTKLGVKEYEIMGEAQKETKLTITDLQSLFLGGCGKKEVDAFKSGEMTFPNLKDSLKLKDALMSIKDISQYSYVRRSLFKVFRQSNGEYMKLANAIRTAKIHADESGRGIPENEVELLDWLFKVYKKTFPELVKAAA